MKMVSLVLSRAVQLQSPRAASHLGVDVRKGWSAGRRLAFGNDVRVPAVAGRFRSLVGSCCSPRSELPQALPTRPAGWWKLPAGPGPRMGLMSAMVAGKGRVAGRGEDSALVSEWGVCRVACLPSWGEDGAPSAMALKYSVELSCPSPPLRPPAPLLCSGETAPAPSLGLRPLGAADCLWAGAGW